MTVERWGPKLAVACAVLITLMGATALAMKQELHRADLGGLPFFAFMLVGAFVAARQPGNAIGWLFMFVGGMTTFGFFSSVYATRAILEDPGSLPLAPVMAWVSAWAWLPGVGTMITFCVMHYPDGRLPSSRWRYLRYLTFAVLAAAIAGIAFMPGKLEPFEEGGPRVPNPFGLEGAEGILDPLANLGFAGMVLAAAVSITSLFFRFRAASPQQRQQIKWFLYPAALLIVVVVFEIPLKQLLDESITEFFFISAILLLPVGTAIGILKHRLFDIDLVINRTLVYLALTAISIAVYLSVVVVLQRALNSVTPDSDIAVAGSTLAVAALFRPLRTRLQAFIDHRFYRRKYDAAETLQRFSSQLRDQVDLGSLSSQIVAVVCETIQPAHASLWLRGRSRS